MFCWLCHKFWKRQIDLVAKLVRAMNKELPIVTINSFETGSIVIGYHVYQGIWVARIGKTLSKEN